MGQPSPGNSRRLKDLLRYPLLQDQKREIGNVLVARPILANRLKRLGE